MTSQQFLVCDASTLANFKSWGSAISGFFATAGWAQSSDTGQVNWSTIGSVPGSDSYVYEIWEPNDSLTNFYVKMEYGNQNSSNSPSLRITIGTSTDGAGTITSGQLLGPVTTVNYSAVAAPSASTTYECDFSGAAGRIAAMMWRNAPTGSNCAQQLFAIERSVNSSGAYTSTYVTLYVFGWAGNFERGPFQQSLIFGVGAAPATLNVTNDTGGLSVRIFNNNGYVNGGTSTTSAAFNNAIPFDTAAPMVGYFDYPGTVLGVIGNTVDVTEGVTFTVTLYGSTCTYMPSKNGAFSGCAPFGGWGNGTLCMRYD